MIKLSVSIFGQTTGYRIYTVSIGPIRLPEIQHPVFWYLINNNIHTIQVQANMQDFLWGSVSECCKCKPYQEDVFPR